MKVLGVKRKQERDKNFFRPMSAQGINQLENSILSHILSSFTLRELFLVPFDWIRVLHYVNFA